MNRRNFVRQTALLGGAVALNPLRGYAGGYTKDFPVVRVAAAERNFSSRAVEAAIREFRANVADEELAWLFNNCFPNTIDTTVTYTEPNGRPDTYVITGDIDAMWLRDSSAQVWPYLQLADQDDQLKKLIAGVINRQTRYVLKDPYANAFYDDPNKRGEWASDYTDMQPGVHERKYEIDSLCYPIRLAYHYWKTTGDTAPFDGDWQNAVKTTLQTFRDQQQKDGTNPYSFMRTTPHATDTRPLRGAGYPVNPVGLICSAFRPSDDATVFSFLVPSNFFAVVSLGQAAEMMETLAGDTATAGELRALAEEVSAALQEHAVVEHEKYGNIYAFEIDGFGNRLMMDDSNVPSLLSLPYLGAVADDDPVYQNTRAFVLSTDNPFFFRGTAAEGIGGPHVGMDYIWPMAITMRGLTSNDDAEIRNCIQTLKATHAGTGFMHEGFHKDDPADFTRSWFAWANTLFGEFLWKTYQNNPDLLT
ncbi:glycoside hydrolase family 125 protein [Lewinella sp. IMCC34183]|uniref:glycoside hydrolase family 125 protein n=1 Tax=Lewinella sp. IMCC34183 TaxID=2248762 RepID=UPI000E248AC3|nr:glycoside hydrolase family 125 protein [Lewinella sp. IMCC34183]